MGFFSQAVYEELLRRAKAKDDTGVIKDACKDFIQYVYEVSDGENDLNTAVDADRSKISNYDSKRHTAHENAISSASMLNRLASEYGLDPVYTGDISQRHQVADFCLEFVCFLFTGRRRVL